MTDRVHGIPEAEGLTFDEAAHVYWLDGLEIPSVSAVMTPLSGAKYGHISAGTLARAAEKGTGVHNAIENWIKYGIADAPPEYVCYLGSFGGFGGLGGFGRPLPRGIRGNGTNFDILLHELPQ